MRSLIGKQPSLSIVLTAWVAFVSLGTALSFLTPLGEGIDEPRHLAYVQFVAQAWNVPMGHTAQISEEITLFLRSHPVGRSLRDRDPSLLSYEDYWNSGASVRETRDRAVRELRFSGRYLEARSEAADQYERHQPPLYYLVTAPIFSVAARFLSFADVVLAVRLWSMLLASLTVPGAHVLATGVFGDRPWMKSILVLTVCFPGLYPGVIRVANDALAVPLATWLLACLVHFLRTERRGFLVSLSALLAAGLWTKAFFIPLLFAVLLTLWLFKYYRQSIAVLWAAGIGSAWYLYNFSMTGSLTGLPETVKAGTSLASSFQTLWALDWGNIAGVMRFSHIWIGNSSLLGAQGWMYRVISWIFLAAVCGCFVGWRSKAPGRILFALILNCLLFAAALLYYATQVFQNDGVSVIQGWYLTLLVPVEAVLFAAGTRSFFPKRWTAVVSVFSFFLLALTVYVNGFVMLPYYAGTTVQAGNAAIILDRLLRFHSWLPSLFPALLIVAFVAAGLGLIIGIRKRAQPA